MLLFFSDHKKGSYAPAPLCPSPAFFSACTTPRAAALLACTCRGFRAAHAESWWPAFDPATGNALEPRSGRFWRELSPGDDVQAAVNTCPAGGCILLRPGTHVDQKGLIIDTPVSVFGRGQATFQSSSIDYAIYVLSPRPGRLFALDGLVVRNVNTHPGVVGVMINAGSPRLQSCDIVGPRSSCGLFFIDASPSPPPVVINCRCGSARGEKRPANAMRFFTF